MAARHLSPGQHGPGDRGPGERRRGDRGPGERRRERAGREAPSARSAAVWWALAALAALVAVLGVLVLVGLQSAARTDSAAEPTSGAGTSAAVAPRPTGSTRTPIAGPSEDVSAVRRAESLMAGSERRLGSTPWKLTTVLRGRSCSVGGRPGLQSEWTDEGPASVSPTTDLATLDSYWRGLGLMTRRSTVSDPTGTFAVVRGDGGPVASIRYSVTGAITTVSECRAPE